MLAHRIANHLAAAETQFVAVAGEIAFDLDDQVGIGQAQPVAGRRTVQPRVLFARDLHANRRSPAVSTRSTGRSIPGSKRTAVPAGMSRSMVRAAARSNASAPLTSAKCACEPTWIGRSPVLLTVSRMRRRPG